jgi:RNA polymerase sigma-70 factor (ECF subfamily)
MTETTRTGDDKPEPAAGAIAGRGGVPPESVDAFARLLGQNQRRIFLYVMSLVPDWNDAEEIVQETNLVLWRTSDRFEPGTNFGAWATKVAFHQVLAWRKRVKRNRLEFSQEFLEAVAEEASAASDVLEERWQKLTRCIERLPADRRMILRLRYSDELSVAAIARRLGRNENAVYHTLGRTRRALHECVTRSRLKEG